MKKQDTTHKISLILWPTIIFIIITWSFRIFTANANSLFQTAVNYEAGDKPSSVAIDDLDGNGKPDLAVANSWNDPVLVLMQNGDDGSWRARKFLSYNLFGLVQGDLEQNTFII